MDLLLFCANVVFNHIKVNRYDGDLMEKSFRCDGLYAAETIPTALGCQ